MARALLIPCAQRETLNPGGTLIFSIGISPGALGAGGWAMGASGESASSRGWPCFQVGGACWARVSEASASTTPSASASDVRVMRRMVSLPSRIERTLFAARTIRPGLLVCQAGDRPQKKCYRNGGRCLKTDVTELVTGKEAP